MTGSRPSAAMVRENDMSKSYFKLKIFRKACLTKRCIFISMYYRNIEYEQPIFYKIFMTLNLPSCY